MIRRNFLKTGLAGMGALAVPGTIHAISSSLPSSSKKWAVVYGSQCGSTKDYAGFINEGMGGIGTVVDITTSPKINDFDYFVIGGWISGGNVQPTSIKSFISSNKTALKDKIKGLFVVCGNQGSATPTPDTDGYLTKQLVNVSGVTNKPGKVLFGKYDPNCGKIGGTAYDNVKKADGVAFGKQIIDAATATILDGSEKSQRFALSHRVNPFTSAATISYSLPGNTTVQLTANALNGRQIATLVSARQDAGSHTVKWNTGTLAPGIYLYRLEAAGHVETRLVKVAGY